MVVLGQKWGSIVCGINGRPSSTYVWCLHDIGRDSRDREKSEFDRNYKIAYIWGEEALAEGILYSSQVERIFPGT